MKKWMPFLAGLSLMVPGQISPQGNIDRLMGLTQDLAVVYAAMMFQYITHEYGHALTQWYNNMPSRIVINATEEKLLKNRIKLKEDFEKNGLSFPKIEVNFIPTLAAYTITVCSDNKIQDITMFAAGPIGGAIACFAAEKLIEKRSSKYADLFKGQAIASLLQFLPIRGWDGYKILENLGITAEKYGISQTLVDCVSYLVAGLITWKYNSKQQSKPLEQNPKKLEESSETSAISALSA